MDAGDNVLAFRVLSIVINEIVAPDSAEIAERFTATNRAQPGVRAGAQVPEVMMRVDDRSAIESSHATFLVNLPVFAQALHLLP